MGALHERLTSCHSTDITASYPGWLPYDLYVKQVNASIAGKSGQVTVINAGQAECDRILNELGVVRRGHSGRSDFDLHISDTRRVPSVDKVVPKQIADQSVALNPKHLTATDLINLVKEGRSKEQIMELYNFTNVNYFRDRVKAIGCKDLFKQIRSVGAI